MKKKKQIIETETEEFDNLDKKATNTAFIMMFPALILSGVAGLYVPNIYAKLLVIALAIYQFLMLKKFITDYYKRY